MSPQASTGPNQIYGPGDSITYGAYPDRVTYASALNSTLRSLGYDYIAAAQGIHGERTYQIRDRTVEEMDIFNPDIVLIHAGTNNLYYNATTAAQAVDDVIDIADIVESRGAAPYVLLIGSYAGGDTSVSAYNTLLKAAADAEGIKTIPVYDSIDLVPGNGAFDGYNAAYYD